MLKFVKKHFPPAQIKNVMDLMADLHQETAKTLGAKNITEEHEKTITKILEVCSLLKNIFSFKQDVGDKQFYNRLKVVADCNTPKSLMKWDKYYLISTLHSWPYYGLRWK